MSRVVQIATNIYGHVLKLYPHHFRAEFGEDMQTVFGMALTDAGRSSSEALVGAVMRELFDLPLNIIREHQRERVRHQAIVVRTVPTEARRVRQARLLIRLAGTALSAFMLYSLRDMLSPGYYIDPQTIPFPGFLFVASVGMLLALRWERAGGVVTMFGGMGMGLFIAAYLYTLSSSAFTLPGMILVGLLWMLPFVIFGMLFYKLGRHARGVGAPVN
jgi:hypothetical protein